MSQKPLFVLLYGGRSSEHEISCRSAAYVVKHLDTNKWDLAIIAIRPDGRFVPQNSQQLAQDKPDILPIQEGDTGSVEIKALEALDPRRGYRPNQEMVVFPLVHGTGGEDGSLQGMFELCGLPYIGGGVAASGVCMDKVLTKRLVAQAGVPIVPYVFIRGCEWRLNREGCLKQALSLNSDTLFVKPTTLGSSVGITKVEAPDQLGKAIDKALSFDESVLIEMGLEVREIEFATMGGYNPEVSPPGEPVSDGKFYSYEAKYLDKETPVADRPAQLDKALMEEGAELARTIFKALGLYGMARVDLFLTSDNKYYLNEVNTIPGFTEISQFPLMWQADGMTPAMIIDRLAELAVARHEVMKKLNRGRE